MSGFQFPPPPPPPPPVASRSDPSQVGQASQPNTIGRGRGRGRGHGIVEHGSRGRGGPRFGTRATDSGNQRQGTYAPYATSANTSLSLHGINQESSFSAAVSTERIDQAPYLARPTLPPGSYINAAFAQNNVLAENDRFYDQRQASQETSNNYQRHQSGPRGSMYSRGSYKRKRDDYRESNLNSQTRLSADLPTNPSTPHFGGAILPLPQLPTSGPGRSKQQARSRSNLFGLMPDGAEAAYSSSESEAEDDVADEESTLGKVLGPGLTFYDVNGGMRTLNSAADLLAWRRARKSNFPTKDRVSQKYLEKRRLGAERKRLLTEAKAKLDEFMLGARPAASKQSTGDGGSNRTVKFFAAEARVSNTGCPRGNVELQGVDGAGTPGLSGAAKREIGSDASREDAEPQDSTERAIQQTVEADVGSGRQSKPLDIPIAAKLASTAGEIEPSGSALEEDVSDDDPPEQVSIKHQPRADTAGTRCKFFAASGYCRDGSACRFKHETANLASAARKQAAFPQAQKRDPFAPVLDEPNANGKKSIHQRLLEREQEDEDQLALQVIKYLGSVNFFSEGNIASTTSSVGGDFGPTA